MPKTFACTTLAVCGLATTASAQIRLSQSVDETTVSAGSGVACAAGTGVFQTTADNRWSRSFSLTEFDVFEDFTVHTVEFGIETLRLPSGTVEGDVTVYLYQVPAGSPPIVGGELVGVVNLTLDPVDLEVFIVDVVGSFDAGTAVMVEVSVPDYGVGGDLGDAFFIGANDFGQTEDGYIASIACGIPEPMDLWEDPFNHCHWIIIAEGDITVACRADIDGDGELTIFDFLAYQNLFDAGDLAADFDGDGSLTIFDFLAFQNEFDTGCA